jgi:hypothetical protein
MRSQTANAIRSVQSKIHWKPGSAVRHLLKRKLRGHLPVEATIDDYEHVIQTVLTETQAQVYLYRHDDMLYISIVAIIQDVIGW